VIVSTASLSSLAIITATRSGYVTAALRRASPTPLDSNGIEVSAGRHAPEFGDTTLPYPSSSPPLDGGLSS
jgi:hypothetical protein